MLRTLSVRTLVTGVLIGIVTNTTSAATRTWNGGGNDANWTTPFNWVGSIAPVAGDSLVFDGFGRLTNTNNLAADTNIAGITFAPTAGAFNLGGNRIALGGDIADNTTLLTQTIALQLLLNANRSVDVAGQGSLTVSGAISDGGGGFGLNKTGAGLLTLSGTNTFTGPINITGGTLSTASAANLGGGTATGGITINGATFRSTGDFTIPATRGIVLGPAGGAGSGTIETLTGSDIIYSGVIANNAGGTGSLNKLKFGTLTLGKANTYSGATNVRNGSLILNFADSAAPTTNIINSASTLVLGGATAGLGQNNNATLSATGKASTANVQSFNNTNVDIYGSVIDARIGTSGTMTVNLGTLTHTTGGTLVVPTGGVNAGNVVNTTTTVGTTNGILGGWAIAGTPETQRGILMGTEWATVDGTGKIVPYTGHVTAPDVVTSNWDVSATLAANADKNLKFTGSATATEMRVAPENAGTTFDINTFQYTTGGGNHTLVIGEGNTLRLGKFGGIYKNANGNNQLFIGGTGGQLVAGPKANAGNLTAGGAPNTPGEIVLTLNDTANNNGGITIVSNIVDNGTGAVTFIKNGVMSAKIDGHNSYTGGTYINQGRFQLAGSEQLRDSVNTALTIGNPDGLGTGPVFVAPGAYLFISGVNGTGQYTGPGAIPNAYFSNGVAGAAASSAQNAPMYNNFTISGNGTNQEGIGAIRLGNRSILLGQITLGGDARIGGGNDYLYPRIELNAGSLQGATPYVDPGNLLSGKITGDFNLDIGSEVSIATNFVLSNTGNDWTGNTNLIGRTGGTASTTKLRLGASGVIPDGAGKGNLTFGNTNNTVSPIFLDLNGFNETVNGLSTASSVNLLQNTIENNGFSASINDPTPNDLTDDNATYSYTAGTSTLTVGGFDQSATFGGVIRDNDPTTAIQLPNPNYEGPADPEADPQYISVTAPWATAGSKVAITKIGTGVQTLSGSNTYTGATTINGGVLSVTGLLDSAGTVTVNSGGTVAGNGDGSSTGKIGNVTVNSGGRVAPGSTGPGSVGSLHMSTLTVTSGNVHIDFSGANSDLVDVFGNASFSGSSSITPFGVAVAGTYTVIQSTSPIAGANTLTLNPFQSLPNTRPAGATLNLTDPNAVKIVVTGGAKTLTWTGATNATWDLGTGGTNNWTDGVISEKFFNGDAVTFNDSSSNLNPVQIVTDVQPSSLTVAGTRNYTFAGTGTISGNTGLTKQGTGTLTLANPNSYIGTTSIEAGGTVQIGNGGTSGSLGSGEVANEGTLIINRSDAHTVANVISGSGEVRHTGTGVTTLSGVSTHTGTVNIQNGTVQTTNSSSLGLTGFGTVNISNGATLDVGGSATANNTDFGTKQINVIGAGVGGQGAIMNSNAAVNQQNAFNLVTLTGDATFNTVGRFDLRDGPPNLDLAGFKLTKKGANQFTVVGGQITDGNIDVTEGTFAMEAAISVVDGGTGKKFTFQNGTRLQFFNTTGGTINRPMEFNGDVNVHQNSGANTTSTFASPITLKGTATFTFQNTGQTVTADGIISDDGTPRSIVVDSTPQPGTLVLNGNNTYKGNTTVNAGSTLTLQPLSGISNLGDTSTLSLATGALLNVNFTNTDTIGQLILGGITQATGVWGAVGSGAAHESAQLVGAGFLNVVAAAIAGDYNNNGVVDAADYAVWRKNVGLNTVLPNDPTGGTIGATQYNTWKANFGKTPGSGSGTGLSGAVPEPASALLCLLGAAGAITVRRRTPIVPV